MNNLPKEPSPPARKTIAPILKAFDKALENSFPYRGYDDEIHASIAKIWVAEKDTKVTLPNITLSAYGYKEHIGEFVTKPTPKSITNDKALLQMSAMMPALNHDRIYGENYFDNLQPSTMGRMLEKHNETLLYISYDENVFNASKKERNESYNFLLTDHHDEYYAVIIYGSQKNLYNVIVYDANPAYNSVSHKGIDLASLPSVISKSIKTYKQVKEHAQYEEDKKQEEEKGNEILKQILAKLENIEKQLKECGICIDEGECQNEEETQLTD